MTYCYECLKKGEKVDTIATTVTFCPDSHRGWCSEHWRVKQRAENPCPKCEKGYIEFGTFDMFCKYCNYREPHIHDIAFRGDGIFALNSPLKPSGKIFPEFVCTCTEWDTPEQHKKRREQFI